MKAKCLAVHPDKNQAPDAEAAFKAVRRALDLVRAHESSTTVGHATSATAANVANATAEVCTPPLPLTDRSAAAGSDAASNGCTAAPTANVSASVGGGGGAVVVPPAVNNNTALGAAFELRVERLLRGGVRADALVPLTREMRAQAAALLQRLYPPAAEAPKAAGKTAADRAPEWPMVNALARPPGATLAFLLVQHPDDRLPREWAAWVHVAALAQAAEGGVAAAAAAALAEAFGRSLQAPQAPQDVGSRELVLGREVGLRGGGDVGPSPKRPRRGQAPGDGGGGEASTDEQMRRCQREAKPTPQSAAGSSAVPAGANEAGGAEAEAAAAEAGAAGVGEEEEAGATGEAESAAAPSPAAPDGSEGGGGGGGGGAAAGSAAELGALKEELVRAKAEINRLRNEVERLRSAAANPDQCSICQGSVVQPAAVNCAAKHTFCKACIRPWLRESCSQCPNCRHEVTELRSPPDADTAEPIPTRQQRAADDGASLEEAVAVDAALDDFIADQGELRRDFDAEGGVARNWSARVEERGAPERREARRRQRRVAAAEAEEVPVEEARLEAPPGSASPMPSREQLHSGACPTRLRSWRAARA